MLTTDAIGVEAVAQHPVVDRGVDGGRWRGHRNPPALSRRGLQYALGVLWIVDGLLQLQPFMFTHGFATQIIAPTAAGQPHWVSWPVLHSAHLIGAHPVAANTVFALTQLGLGAAFFFPRTVRLAVIASIGWAASVWFLGEGLGGLAGGTATLLAGAPGAALLYAVLAVAANPSRPEAASDRAIPRWFLWAWSILWFGQALLALLPANHSDRSVVDQVQTAGDSAPGWLRAVDSAFIHMAHGLGETTVILLIAVPIAIGLSGLGNRAMRRVSASAGLAVALVTWVVGQSFGSLASGMATDPSTGPLIMLAAFAVLGVGSTADSADDASSLDQTCRMSDIPHPDRQCRRS